MDNPAVLVTRDLSDAEVEGAYRTVKRFWGAAEMVALIDDPNPNPYAQTLRLLKMVLDARGLAVPA